MAMTRRVIDRPRPRRCITADQLHEPLKNLRNCVSFLRRALAMPRVTAEALHASARGDMAFRREMGAAR